MKIMKLLGHSAGLYAAVVLGVSLNSTAFAAPLACEAYVGTPLSAMQAYEGITHEHSSYSDGDPQTIPADYNRIAKANGYGFMAGSEHSDSLDDGVLVGLHANCDPSSGSFNPLNCQGPASADRAMKWTAIGQQAKDASTANFLAIRGFEWTSDVFGHINVYFGKNFTNAKTDGGYATTMATFWNWFSADANSPSNGAASSEVPTGGGNDSLAHFNHPHDKCQTKSDPTGAASGECDWNDFTLIPAAVDRMFGIEAYNDANRGDRYQPYIAKALDKGWRLSFVGSEDDHFAKYAVEDHPKTVTLATNASAAAFREAWLARRTYALSNRQHLRVNFDAEGHPMGSQMNCTIGKNVPMHVSVTQKDGSATTGSLRLYSNGGVELGRIDATTGTFNVPVLPGKHWYFVRAHGADGMSTAYIAPVWINGGAPTGQWLGGDMHVHTDHSSDGSAVRQANSQKGPGNVSDADQIGEAEKGGLDWLPLTDHRTYDQHYDPLWESSKLLLIPGEEANGGPHCTVHGAVDMMDQGDAPAGSPEFRSTQQSIWSAHAQGAVFAIAHPDDGELNADKTVNNRANVVGMDSMEAWNRGSDVETEMDYAENRWNKGFRFGINGASDDHFKELWGITSPGTPRTEVFSSNRSERGILQAMKAGRFMLQLRNTDPFVTLEGDFDGDGVYEALQGDEVLVPAGSAAKLRIHVLNGTGLNVLLYQAPGRVAGMAPVQTFSPLASDESFYYAYNTGTTPSWFRVEVRGAGENAGVDTNAIKAVDLATLMGQAAMSNNARRAVTSALFVSSALVNPSPEQAIPADAGSDDGAQWLLGEPQAFSGFPAVASANRVVHVVAEQHAPGVTQVFYRRQTASGNSDAVLLSGSSAAARFPKIAAQGQNVWVVWEDERAGQVPRRKAIYLRQSHDGGLSWDAETLVRSLPGRAEHPVVAATADGHAIVAWAEIQAGKPFDIWAQIWGVDAAPVNVSGTGKLFAAASATDTRSALYPTSVWPSLATAANGSIALAWQDNRTDLDPLFTGATSYGNGTAPDNWQIMVSTRSGMLWNSPASMGANTQADRHPVLAYGGNGTLVVAWDSKPLVAAGPNLNVLSALSHDGGQTFSSPTVVAGSSTVFAQRPALATGRGGRVQLAWFDNGSVDWRWRIARSALEANEAWRSIERINSVGNNTWPALAEGGLVFASTRNASRLQRDLTQQIMFLPTPPPLPQPFTFVERINVPLSYFITSEPIALSGFDGELELVPSEGTQVSINGGPFSTDIRQVKAGDKIIIRHLSAATMGTSRETTVSVGGFVARLKTTTTVEDRVPAPFSFGQKIGQTAGQLSSSDAIVLSDYTHPAPVSAGPGCEYSINGAPFTRSNGTLPVGAKLQIRHIASSKHLEYHRSYLNVGGVVGYYISRTK